MYLIPRTMPRIRSVTIENLNVKTTLGFTTRKKSIYLFVLTPGT